MKTFLTIILYIFLYLHLFVLFHWKERDFVKDFEVTRLQLPGKHPLNKKMDLFGLTAFWYFKWKLTFIMQFLTLIPEMYWNK